MFVCKGTWTHDDHSMHVDWSTLYCSSDSCANRKRLILDDRQLYVHACKYNEHA